MENVMIGLAAVGESGNGEIKAITKVLATKA
jgi:hypothetical protein